MKTIHPKSLEEWRSWLERNHDREPGVRVLKYKVHTKKPTLTHRESMKEAICFGWIDTTIKKIDDERYARIFVPRSDNSRWSNATLSYAREMVQQGKMTPAGLKRYEEGLKKPTIDLPKNLPVPDVLKKELSKNPEAKRFFDSLAPSYRRVYIAQVVKVKLDETKLRKAKWVVDRCAQGKKFTE